MEKGKIKSMKSETSEPTVTKFCIGDYDMTSHANIQTDRPSEGVPPNTWDINVACLLAFLGRIACMQCTNAAYCYKFRT